MRFNKVGRWWSKDAEIDVVAVNEDDNSALFGEAKWSTRKIGIDVLSDLKKKAPMVEWGKKNRKEIYALFSRKGFTEELKSVADKEKIILRTIDDMI